MRAAVKHIQLSSASATMHWLGANTLSLNYLRPLFKCRRRELRCLGLLRLTSEGPFLA